MEDDGIVVRLFVQPLLSEWESTNRTCDLLSTIPYPNPSKATTKNPEEPEEMEKRRAVSSIIPTRMF